MVIVCSNEWRFLCWSVFSCTGLCCVCDGFCPVHIDYFWVAHLWLMSYNLLDLSFPNRNYMLMWARFFEIFELLIGDGISGSFALNSYLLSVNQTKKTSQEEWFFMRILTKNTIEIAVYSWIAEQLNTAVREILIGDVNFPHSYHTHTQTPAHLSTHKCDRYIDWCSHLSIYCLFFFCHRVWHVAFLCRIISIFCVRCEFSFDWNMRHVANRPSITNQVGKLTPIVSQTQGKTAQTEITIKKIRALIQIAAISCTIDVSK